MRNAKIEAKEFGENRGPENRGLTPRKTGDRPQLPLIQSQPGLKTVDLARVTDMPRRTIERWLQQLKPAGRIEFRGAPKTGGYHAK